MTPRGTPTELVAGVRRVLAPNPGPMTLEGTNTWVLTAPGSPSAGGEGAVVIDPGPDDTLHREAVVAAARGTVSLILTTHRHDDHTDGVAALAAATGARVIAAAEHPRSPGEPPSVIVGLPAALSGLRVITTPGHTADSLCFWWPLSPGVLFTGDTVLGAGPSVIDTDGDLGDFLDSLTTLHALAAAHPHAVLAPGHGPVGAPAAGVIAAALAHRAARLEQVARAVSQGAPTAAAVVDVVYPDLPPRLRPAAERTAAATLAYGRAHLGWPPSPGEAD